MASDPYAVGRRPDYKVSALSRSSEHKGNIGVAWVNQDGTVSIKLNPFTVLSAAQDLLITLFPNDDADRPRKKKRVAEDVPTV